MLPKRAGVINVGLATVGVVYVTDILAQHPAGFDIVQILLVLCSQFVMQSALSASDSAIPLFAGQLLVARACYVTSTHEVHVPQLRYEVDLLYQMHQT